MQEEIWLLRYDPRVRKHLAKLQDKAVIRRIQEAAERLRENPYSGKQLKGYPAFWSKRIGTPGGEYRILYLLCKEEHEVFVVLIGSREEIYDILKRSGL